MDGEGSSNFKLANEDSGAVLLAKELDYEEKTKYSLTVQAADGGEGTNQKVANGTLTVNVLNVNDNLPLFLEPGKGTYACVIEEQKAASASHLDLSRVPYGLYGVKYIGPVSLEAARARQSQILTSHPLT